MTKREAEKAIRHLCHKWAELRGIIIAPETAPSFGDFIAWIRENYPDYLRFRSTTGAEYDIEMWFDQEMKQTWRN